MKYYIAKEAKNGTLVYRANKKLTDGKRTTDDVSKAYFFYSEEQANDYKYYDNEFIISYDDLQKRLILSFGSKRKFNVSSDDLYE